MSVKRGARAVKSVMGIDASLNSTGVSVRDSTGRVVTTRITSGKRRELERLEWNHNRLRDLILAYEPEVVVIEGYAMGKASNNLASIGEWGGIAKLLAHQHGAQVITITPSSLRMMVTGDGSTKGKLIMKECLHKLSSDYHHVTQNDEVDACCLMLVGEALVNRSGSPRLIQSLRSKMKEDKPGIHIVN